MEGHKLLFAEDGWSYTFLFPGIKLKEQCLFHSWEVTEWMPFLTQTTSNCHWPVQDPSIAASQITSSTAEQKSKELLMPEKKSDKYTAGKIYNPDIRRKCANLVVRKSTSFYSDSSTVDKHIVRVRNKLHSEKPDIASFPTA
ncbi:hypothetical protein CEXT_405541 [Caerostris extrusa]|uniref:Uncharacterized protein n=1 Tax=Caerostris extrusa TaxID=172846 RepID=A0AAV4NTV3_CAEEX|nr:hypothetical protein CEXT_405541 [Caerostris extrusa]